jgi:SAM-dependent methyltransferase
MNRDLSEAGRNAHACVCCGSTRLGASPAILMPFVAHRALGWAPVEIDESWGLMTIRRGMAYSICNTLACTDCGLLFLDIRFSQAELDALYADYRGADYVALREHYEPGYAQRNTIFDVSIGHLHAVEAFLAPFVPQGPRVLDWGGNTGRNTPFSGRRTLCHIYDISDKPVLDGARRVDEATALSTEYDLVVCSHVLEHVPYPLDLLAELRKTLRGGTVLYVEVPYEELMRASPGAGEAGRKKRHWHEHINFFSRQALSRLLMRAGLEILAERELHMVAEGRPAAVFQAVCQLPR